MSTMSWLAMNTSEIKQKFDTPPESDGTRIFYESLLRENPNSQMAYKYCCENGIIKSKNYIQAQRRSCAQTQASS